MEGWRAYIDGKTIFYQPDGREHGLCKSPGQRPLVINGQVGCIPSEPSFDVSRGSKLFTRIAEAGPKFVRQLAYDAFGIDGDPAALCIKQNVGMVKVTVKKLRIALGGAKRCVYLLRVHHERGGDLWIAAFQILLKPLPPVLHGGKFYA